MHAVATLAFLASLQAEASQPADPATGPKLAIVGAGVLDVESGRLLADQTVLVRGARIERVGPAAEVEVPADHPRIDARELMLLPGLCDLGVSVADGSELPAYLAHGVTTIRVLDGGEYALALREELERGERLGPRMFVGSPAVVADGDVRALAAGLAQRGYDFVTSGALPPESVSAWREAAREAGLELIGPAPSIAVPALSPRDLPDGVHRLENLVGAFDSARSGPKQRERMAGWPAALAASKTSVTTGMASFIALLQRARGDPELESAQELAWIDPVSRFLWSGAGRAMLRKVERGDVPALERNLTLQLQLLGELHRAGVAILPASDAMSAHAPAGLAFQRELALWERAGIAPIDALRAATLGAARALGRAEDGALRAGARADLVLVAGDPRVSLGCLAQPAGVVAAGRWLPRAELDRVLEEVGAANEAATTFVGAALEPEPGLEELTRLFAPQGEWPAGGSPVRPELAHLLGRVIARTKDRGDARELAELCVSAYPDAWWAHAQLAEFLIQEGERRRPRRQLERALELRPGEPTCSALLAQLGPPPPVSEPAEMVDWARFRGPSGCGVAEVSDLPGALDTTQNLRWRTALPSGYSSPILYRGRLFLTAHEGPRALAYCLERETGEILWSVRAPGRIARAKDKRIRSTSPSPAVADDGVYVFFESFGLFAYDFDGAERWRLPLGPFLHAFGHGSSPVLAGELVLLQCDHDRESYLLAVDRSDGKPRWRVERPESSDGYSTPLVYEPEGLPAQVVCSGSYRVDSYSLGSGELVWWAEGMASMATTVPTIVGERLYVHSWTNAPRQMGVERFSLAWPDALSTYDADANARLARGELEALGLAYAFDFHDSDRDGELDHKEWERAQGRRRSKNGLHAIRLGGQGDVSASHREWTQERGVPHTSSPLVYRGLVYMLTESGILTALDATSGEVVKSERVGEGGDQYYASPVAGDGWIYLASHGGVVRVLRAGRDWEVVSSVELEGDIFATPALAPGRVYVRTEEQLYCFGGAESAR